MLPPLKKLSLHYNLGLNKKCKIIRPQICFFKVPYQVKGSREQQVQFTYLEYIAVKRDGKPNEFYFSETTYAIACALKSTNKSSNSLTLHYHVIISKFGKLQKNSYTGCICIYILLVYSTGCIRYLCTLHGVCNIGVQGVYKYNICVSTGCIYIIFVYITGCIYIYI